jgi:large subunit ribosomal protein L13
MKSVNVKPADFQKKWVIVDATDQTLGRLASEIASVMRGKLKPTFTPYLDTGDNVIVINAAKIKLTGNKWTQKHYFHHTGYIGGIKSLSAQQLHERDPSRLVTIAVEGMLPKSKLGKQLHTNLRVFADAKHDMEAQKPVPMGTRLQKK